MPSFITDFVSMFLGVSQEIVGARTFLNLPPLVCPSSAAGVVGSLMIGEEWLRREHSPPRIIIVPMGTRYEPARRSGVQPYRGRIEEQSNKYRQYRWIQFEAHLWGDPDLTGVNALQDFNSCVELERELLTSLYDNCGNTPNVRVSDGRWEQPTHDLRFGRLLVVPFAIGTPVVDLPYVILPYATDTSSGVSIDTTVEVNWPDGSSTVVGVIVAPPP